MNNIVLHPRFKDNQYGYVDRHGTIAIPLQYDDAEAWRQIWYNEHKQKSQEISPVN